MKHDLPPWPSIMRLVLFLLPATLAASAQTVAPDRPSTDAEKIADALRAGPRFITKDATLLDWPTAPDGEYRVLRRGTNEWTCLPGVQATRDEPGCFDPTFMQWMKDSLAGREPHIDRIGISYMYTGAWVPNNSSENHGSTSSEFHVGHPWCRRAAIVSHSDLRTAARLRRRNRSGRYRRSTDWYCRPARTRWVKQPSPRSACHIR
jgi:hypothetical protein